MQNDILAALSQLSDAQLVAQVRTLVARKRDAAAQIVAHLAELDTRDVHLREGYSSLYLYCRDALGLSEWEAYNRIEVARAARRFPVILDMLADGTVQLTTVRLLAPHLTPGNHREVLESVRGKRKPEVAEIVARLSPRPDVPPSVRRLPTGHPEATRPAAPAPVATPPATAPVSVPDPPAPALAVHPLPVHRRAVTPLSPDRYKLQLTIGGETLERFRLAKDMLGHAIPSGDEAKVLDRALKALLVDLAKKKFADTRRPREAREADPRGRYVPARVRRAVWVRDLGRCAFVGTNGHRCDERRSWSSIISIRTLWAARRRSSRSRCGAGVTTTMKDGCTSGSAGRGPMARSCERSRRPTGRVRRSLCRTCSGTSSIECHPLNSMRNHVGGPRHALAVRTQKALEALAGSRLGE